jgi:hypothetical protein
MKDERETAPDFAAGGVDDHWQTASYYYTVTHPPTDRPILCLKALLTA